MQEDCIGIEDCVLILLWLVLWNGCKTWVAGYRDPIPGCRVFRPDCRESATPLRMFRRAALVLHTPARWSHDCVKIVDGLRFVMGLKILWILCVLRSSVWYELFCRPRCLGGEGVSHSDRGSYDTSAVRPAWFYILRPFSRSDREGIL